MTDQADLFDIPQKAPPDKLRQISKLVHDALQYGEIINDLESQLAATRGALHVLRTKSIPDLITESQLESVTVDGWEVKLKDFVSGSLPSADPEKGDPAKRAAAIQYLIENEGEGLIKTTLSLEFGRSQHNEALALADTLTKAGHNPAVSSGVHAQTLCAWVRERLEDGKKVNAPVLGVSIINVADIKESPEAKKARKRAGLK